MAVYFFDTSALAKLYHAEAGTQVVDRIVDSPDSLIRISRLRTLDALQLAVALQLRNHNLLDNLVAADTIFCEIARLEGLTVVNTDF